MRNYVPIVSNSKVTAKKKDRQTDRQTDDYE